MEVNEAKRVKDLELENNKLKRILAEKLLEVEALKDVKRQMVGRLINEHKLSARTACKLLVSVEACVVCSTSQQQ